MWNNLRSDLYRITHMKAFYISIGVAILVNVLLLWTTGFQMNSDYANFSSETDTFAHFMYYIFKSPAYLLIVLVFLSLFHNDEYDKGFAKNIMPITYHKGKLILERYIVCVIVCVLIWGLILIPSVCTQFIYPLAHSEALHIGNYLIYSMFEILLLSTIASFIMMINHLTRNRVLIILICSAYAVSVLYMLEVMIASLSFGNLDILKYTFYQVSGALPETFQWKEYQFALMILLGNTILYNGISYLLLKKKDI